MKLVARLLLVLFVAFLSTPTIVKLIEKDTDISSFYSFSEEELHKDYKEIKADLSHEYEFVFVDLSSNISVKIISENLSRHDNVSEEIFSPPPELV
jgi:MinD-like ATPase involved in chromosome partitioning or flagellar assembly